MTLYMLDTNIVSDLVREPQGKAARAIAAVGEDLVCTSVIVACELRYGCAKLNSGRLTKAVEDILDELPVLPFETAADVEYGAIRAELEALGLPIGGNDTMIAAHARAMRATMVTANVREFRRVRALTVENWLA